MEQSSENTGRVNTSLEIHYEIRKFQIQCSTKNTCDQNL